MSDSVVARRYRMPPGKPRRVPLKLEKQKPRGGEAQFEYCEHCGSKVRAHLMQSRAWDHIALDRPDVRELVQRYAEILLLESESVAEACRKAGVTRRWMERALARMFGREISLPGEKDPLPAIPWKDGLAQGGHGVDGPSLTLRRWRQYRGRRAAKRRSVGEYRDLATPYASQQRVDDPDDAGGEGGGG